MTFGAPQYLYALIALPALMVFVWWAFSRRDASVRRIGDPALIERLSTSVNRGMRRRRLILWFVGVSLIIFALARPQWGSDVQIVEHRGVQVMVALDISRSMLAQDLKPTRLERAKLEISDMMSGLTGDEVGIVLFSGASFIQFPLTFDYATARTYLRNANPGIISRQGTVIAKAIETAMTGFNEERVSQKIIVIMTDGENHEGDPIGAARQAAEEGAVIYTVGFGSPEGEPIPVYDAQGNVTGYREDDQGRVVISSLDEATLQEVARAGGGRYFRAAERGAIAGLVDEIQSFQDESLESEFNRKQIERFQIFLLAGILSLVLAEVMTDRFSFSLWRRRTTVVEEAGHA
ncbi:MAG: VWA domain-containing protein [Dehalococcoidia bacterium]|nr:VWA domain-containing protein [Dehalococcoidia bacterium]